MSYEEHVKISEEKQKLLEEHEKMLKDHKKLLEKIGEVDEKEKKIKTKKIKFNKKLAYEFVDSFCYLLIVMNKRLCEKFGSQNVKEFTDINNFVANVHLEQKNLNYIDFIYGVKQGSSDLNNLIIKPQTNVIKRREKSIFTLKRSSNAKSKDNPNNLRRFFNDLGFKELYLKELFNVQRVYVEVTDVLYRDYGYEVVKCGNCGNYLYTSLKECISCNHEAEGSMNYYDFVDEVNIKFLDRDSIFNREEFYIDMLNRNKLRKTDFKAVLRLCVKSLILCLPLGKSGLVSVNDMDYNINKYLKNDEDNIDYLTQHRNIQAAIKVFDLTDKEKVDDKVCYRYNFDILIELMKKYKVYADDMIEENNLAKTIKLDKKYFDISDEIREGFKRRRVGRVRKSRV